MLLEAGSYINIAIYFTVLSSLFIAIVLKT